MFQTVDPNQNNLNLISYEGPFFIDLLTLMGNYLKLYTFDDPVAQKKLFKIYVELAQNVSNYAENKYILKNEKREVGVGSLHLCDKNQQYRFTTQNVVKKEDAKVLSQRCEIINTSDYHELKELKRELRKSAPSSKYGARIGLIHAKLLSNNNLDYSVIEKDKDYSVFKITAKVDKNEKHRN